MDFVEREPIVWYRFSMITCLSLLVGLLASIYFHADSGSSLILIIGCAVVIGGITSFFVSLLRWKAEEYNWKGMWSTAVVQLCASGILYLDLRSVWDQTPYSGQPEFYQLYANSGSVACMAVVPVVIA